MMIKIAPLIRSRTRNMPYSSDYFIVRPDDFSKNDINWAAGLVAEAMRNVDDNCRVLAASKGDKKIAGIACTMRKFAADCLQGDEDQSNAQNYTKEKSNRDFDVFLGFAFKPSGNELPDVTPSDIWQCFKETLMPKWEFAYVDAITANYREPEGSRSFKTTFPNEELFKKYLAQAISGDTAVIIENSSVRKIPAAQPPKLEPKEIPAVQAESDTQIKEPVDNKKKPNSNQTIRRKEEDTDNIPWKIIVAALSVAVAILYWLIK